MSEEPYMTTKTNIEAVNSGQTERSEALRKWVHECENGGVTVTNFMRSAYRDGFDDARAASPAPASPSGEDAAEQAAAPMADDVEDDDIQPTPESERAAFNAMMRWHLIRLLQAWRYGGDLRAAGMAAFEWARSNDVGKAAFEASERAVKLSADLPPASEQALKRFGESQFRCGHDQATSEFKNFHRLLCERFGYVHDEQDWKRDQLSLIEWIASALPRASEQADEAVTRLRRALTAEKVAGQEPYGYAPVHPNGNYFTRNKSTADYVGGLMPVYATTQPAQPVAQTLALTDEQRHSVDFAAALLEVKGYTGRARDLRSILAAQPVSGGKS